MQKKTPFLIFYIIISIYLVCLVNGLTFISMSPDSFRFISIAQNNIESGNGLIGNLFHYFKDASSYDMHRSRHAQYLMYLIDLLTHNYMQLPFANYSMTFIILTNAYLIGEITRLKFNFQFKFYAPLAISILFLASCFSLSPIILLILYGKIIWLTFILAFFNTTKKYLKIIYLILAAFSDEFGLFSVLIIIFLYSLKLIFTNPLYNISFRLKLLFPLFISIMCLLSFYGFNAILFNTGASSLINFANTQSKLISSTPLVDIPKNFGWALQEIILGHFENQYLTYLLGIAVIYILLLALYRKIILKYILMIRIHKLEKTIELLSNDSNSQIYLFWLSIFIFINFIAIPGGYGDITHYGYAKFTTFYIILVYSILELIDTKRKEITLFYFLGVFLFFHIFNFNNTLRYTQIQLDNYLYADKTVNKLEILTVFNEAYKTRKTQKINPKFYKDTLNLDSSGTWFYSKEKNVILKKHSHFPINGMYKTLIWPLKI
jgi:hypothetical protein